MLTTVLTVELKVAPRFVRLRTTLSLDIIRVVTILHHLTGGYCYERAASLSILNFQMESVRGGN